MIGRRRAFAIERPYQFVSTTWRSRALVYCCEIAPRFEAISDCQRRARLALSRQTSADSLNCALHPISSSVLPALSAHDLA